MQMAPPIPSPIHARKRVGPTSQLLFVSTFMRNNSSNPPLGVLFKRMSIIIIITHKTKTKIIDSFLVPVCFALNPCLYDSTTLTLFIYSQISPGSPHLSFSLKYIIFFFNYNKIRDSPVSSEGQNVPTGPNTKKEKKIFLCFWDFQGIILRRVAVSQELSLAMKIAPSHAKDSQPIMRQRGRRFTSAFDTQNRVISRTIYQTFCNLVRLKNDLFDNYNCNKSQPLFKIEYKSITPSTEFMKNK